MDSNANSMLIQEPLAEQLQAWMQEQQPAMVAMLEELALLETPSDRPETQPPIINTLSQLLADLDYHVHWLSGQKSGGQLYASPQRRPKQQACQLLLGHCDTVWPVGKLNDMPVSIEGNVMRGPGVFDMKAGLVMIVFALRALKHFSLQPEVIPIIFINSDEEIGSKESTRMIKRLAKIADRALIMEPSMGDAGDLKTARKGVGRFVVTARGKAAHAGLDPEAGASAILELSHVIQQLFELNDYDKGISVNVGMIDGGIRANVIAPESKAVVDVRVLHQHDADAVEKRILALEPTVDNVTLEIEGRIGRPPMEKTKANRKLWSVMQDIASSMQIALGENTAGGGSDGNTTSLYTATLDGMGAVGDGAHAQHEFVYIDKLPERGTLLALMLLTPALNQSSGSTRSNELN